MFSIVNSLIARLKALFVMHAALEIEAELIASCAERRAELLRQAKRYEEEGLQGIVQRSGSTGSPLQLDLYTLVTCENRFDELVWRAIIVHNDVMCDHLRGRIDGIAVARHVYFCRSERKRGSIVYLVPRIA
jgi:hypothetical protein